MFNARFALVTGLLTIGVAASQATFFYNQVDFLAAVKSDYYLEQFNALTGSGLGANTYNGVGTSGNGLGYSWQASATHDLSGLTGGMLATTNSSDSLAWSFTGSSKTVTAFGGYFNVRNGSGTVQSGTVHLTVGSDTSNEVSGFVGWVGDVGLNSGNTSLGGNAIVNTFIAADDVYTGQKAPASTPEPFTMSLGLASAGLFVRRRLKSKRA